MPDDEVLIVGDDPEILKVFKRTFHGKLNVDTAASGEKRLEAVFKRDLTPITVEGDRYTWPSFPLVRRYGAVFG